MSAKKKTETPVVETPVAPATVAAEPALSAYEKKRIAGERIDQLMQAGKSTADEIAKAVGCSLARVNGHFEWANDAKEPRYALNDAKQIVLVGKPIAFRKHYFVPAPVEQKPTKKSRSKKAATATA